MNKRTAAGTCAIAFLVATAFCLGVATGRAMRPVPPRPPESHGKHMNDLLSVGFKITDPEGFEVTRWDE